MKALQNPYFLVHGITAALAYLAFTFSFVAGLVYLWQDRRLKHRQFVTGPSLEAMERVIFNALLAGLPLLTLALLSGFVWMKQEFGTWWIWNSKIIASVFAWVVYSALFYFHYVSSVHGRKMVVLSVFAFSLIAFTFFALSLFEAQIHAYS